MSLLQKADRSSIESPNGGDLPAVKQAVDLLGVRAYLDWRFYVPNVSYDTLRIQARQGPLTLSILLDTEQDFPLPPALSLKGFADGLYHGVSDIQFEIRGQEINIFRFENSRGQKMWTLSEEVRKGFHDRLAADLPVLFRQRWPNITVEGLVKNGQAKDWQQIKHYSSTDIKDRSLLAFAHTA